MQGINLLDAILPYDKFQVYTINENGTANGTGLNMDLMAILEKKLNFTRKAVEPDDLNYGVEIDEGKFNGIIGMLQNGIVDISTAGLTIMIERSNVIDQTLPITTGTNTLIKKVKLYKNMYKMYFI